MESEKFTPIKSLPVAQYRRIYMRMKTGTAVRYVFNGQIYIDANDLKNIDKPVPTGRRVKGFEIEPKTVILTEKDFE